MGTLEKYNEQIGSFKTYIVYKSVNVNTGNI